jgi:hypothetical protein
MYLVQILLPLYDNDKHPFSRLAFEVVRAELTEHFGGVTAFVRSPAEGVWKEDQGKVSHDEVVMFEVMTQSLQHEWWSQYRRVLEQRFKQKDLIVMAIHVEKL